MVHHDFVRPALRFVRQNDEIKPLPGAWNGKGEVPLTFGVYSDGTGADKEASAVSAASAQPDHAPAPRNQPHAPLTAAPRPLFDAAGGAASFLRHLVPDFEWSVRVDMAAVCRLISRLNGHVTYEGSFAHFSYAPPISIHTPHLHVCSCQLLLSRSHSLSLCTRTRRADTSMHPPRAQV